MTQRKVGGFLILAILVCGFFYIIVRIVEELRHRSRKTDVLANDDKSVESKGLEKVENVLEDEARFNSTTGYYLALFLGFTGLSPLVSGYIQIILGVIAVFSLLCLVFVLYPARFRKWASRVSSIPIKYYAIFIGFFTLGMSYIASGQGLIWLYSGAIITLISALFLLLHLHDVTRKGTAYFTKRERWIGIFIILVCSVVGILVGRSMGEWSWGMVIGEYCGLMIVILGVPIARWLTKKSKATAE